LERYGLVSLEKKGKAVVPRTVYDRVEVNFDLIGGTHWKSERRMA
jgi:predicted transcriptional regulator